MRTLWGLETTRPGTAVRNAHRRRFLLFCGLVLCSVTMLVLWGSESDGGPVARGVSVLVGPIASVEQGLSRWITGGGDRIGDLRATAREVSGLRERVLALEADLLEMEVVKAENEVLRESLELPPGSIRRVIPARVVARQERDGQWLVVDRGEEDGVKVYDGVLHPDGVVGRVDRSLPRASRVLLITDPSFTLGVRMKHPEIEGFIEGRVRGLPDGIHLLLITKSPLPFPPGTEVLTSSLSTIFPSGRPVGTILEPSPSPGTLFDEYIVRPRVDPLTVDSVLVLTGFETRQAMELHRD